MITSIPESALELGINKKEYIEIARNTKRISNIPKSKRQNIIKRANEELSGRLRIMIDGLKKDIFYDKEFNKIAELDYSGKYSEEENKLTAGIVDYFLRNMKEGLLNNNRLIHFSI